MRCFVDTNIILQYVNRENTRLIEFVHGGRFEFYYTETVARECEPHQVPPVFRLVQSGAHETRKHNLYADVVKHTGLTDVQARRFRNDLFILFECGCALASIIDDFAQPLPFLLTNNLKLYRRFIESHANQTALETCVNQHGFEHIPDVQTPDSIIPNYELGWIRL
jgi:hypothetical protein